MKNIIAILLLFFAVNLFGQGMRCSTCPPAVSGQSGKVLSNNGSAVQWVAAGSGVSDSAWGLTGNAGTDPTTNYIGTSDNDTLYISLNGDRSGTFDRQRANFGIGNLQFTITSTGQSNSAFGSVALANVTSGDNNVGMGAFAGASIRQGSNNTFIGANAGYLADADSSETNAIALGYGATAVTDEFAIGTQTQIKFALNAHSAGDVLTSDGTGIGTWQDNVIPSSDSVSIYALSPTAGKQYYCTDCSGNGITGRIVAYIGAAWRRLLFED